MVKRFLFCTVSVVVYALIVFPIRGQEGLTIGLLVGVALLYVSLVEFRRKKPIVSLLMGSLSFSMLLSLLLPIWGHVGFRSDRGEITITFHEHYIWDAGHIH